MTCRVVVVSRVLLLVALKEEVKFDSAPVEVGESSGLKTDRLVVSREIVVKLAVLEGIGVGVKLDCRVGEGVAVMLISGIEGKVAVCVAFASGV